MVITFRPTKWSNEDKRIIIQFENSTDVAENRDIIIRTLMEISEYKAQETGIE